MPDRSFRLRSASEQVAAHLREEITAGHLQGEMPGVHALASEFGIHRTTAEEALRLLEQEELIVGQGSGKRRKILPLDAGGPTVLRVALLLSGPEDAGTRFIGDLQNRLKEGGHEVTIVGRTLAELHQMPERVATVVKNTPADAWIVVAGSRAVLEWFCERNLPCFALFGNPGPTPLPHTGPIKAPVIAGLVDRLVGLGHRRIVMLIADQHRKPRIGNVARRYLDTLEAHGIPTSNYHLPDWKYSPQGLHRCLESLFRQTPPTALLVDECNLMFAVMQFLAGRGMAAPGDLSLVCLDHDSSFDWTQPPVAHLKGDERPWVRRVVRWAGHVAAGKTDRRRSRTKTRLFEGGTIGPPPAE